MKFILESIKDGFILGLCLNVFGVWQWILFLIVTGAYRYVRDAETKA